MDNNIRLSFLDDNGLNYYLFDSEGHVIFNAILNQSNQNNISDFDAINYSELLEIHQKESDGYYLSNDVYLRYKDKSQIINLIDLIDKIHFDKDWDYEYIESIKTTNKPFEIAFITHNPNYGVQGIKIFNFNTSFDFSLIYEMEDLYFEGAFHNLAFNKNGDKYSLLLYHFQGHKDYLTICEYSVKKNKRSLNERPLNLFKTDFGYWQFGKLKMEYLNDNTLRIVRNSDVIFFDLEKGKATNRK